MGGDGLESHDSYRTLKERLSNQPRSRQVLEQLEKYRPDSSLLAAVAEKLVSGQYGEAEIQSAIYCELLKNRDRKAILKRVADLRSAFVKIQIDLSHTASEIYQLKSWAAHQVVGYDDWTEFSEWVLGLSDKVAEALLTAREQVSGIGLDEFLQVMIKGYMVPASSHEEHTVTAEKLELYKPSLEACLKQLKQRLTMAEFKAGDEIRARKVLEKELEKTRAEMYQKVQEKQTFIDKLTRSIEQDRLPQADRALREVNTKPKGVLKPLLPPSQESGVGGRNTVRKGKGPGVE
jgi:hypothetical protein